MIYIWWAAPRQGKTYGVTKLALDQMKKNLKLPDSKKIKVFSNYPIYDKKVGYSLEWKPELASADITDAMVVIDEAYRDYNSRNFKETKNNKGFTADEHLFFATNGHNNVDIHLIAHSPARLDTVIREMTNTFYFVKKYCLPFSSRPILFKVEGYLDEIAIAQRHMSEHAVYSVDYYFFRRSVAAAYDTHYFRREDVKTDFTDWGDKLAPKTLISVDNGSCFNSFTLPPLPKKKFFTAPRVIKWLTFCSLYYFTIYYWGLLN